MFFFIEDLLYGTESLITSTTKAKDPYDMVHPPVKFGKKGILIVNLGTPDATDFWSIRRYLKEFLSDRRVIELNPVIWQIILNLFVLTTRPQKTAKVYQEIWDKEQDKSPLLIITENQAKKMAEHFKDDEKIMVDFAMRYGNPSIKSKINEMRKNGCENITLLPLYPQYCAATTATVCDEAFRTLMKMRWQPIIKIVPPYYDHPFYIDSLANSLTEHLEELDWKPDLIITSYHGIPNSYFKLGDPYHCYCYKTTRLLREQLKMDKDKVKVTFQSRFGPEEWLQPYTDDTLVSLVKQGIKKVVIMTPGFASDCIETLEEINMGSREIFMAAGGEQFSFISCLNDRDDHIKLLTSITS